MISSPDAVIDESDMIQAGLGALLLCAISDNFILMKYFLSEEFSSIWNYR